MDGEQALKEWGGYAITIARKVMGLRRHSYCYSFMKDAEQVALIELFRCGNNFDASKGEFNHYVSSCVGSKVQDFRDNNTYVVTPRSWGMITSVIYNAYTRLLKGGKVAPTIEDVLAEPVIVGNSNITKYMVTFWFELYNADDTYYYQVGSKRENKHDSDNYEMDYDDSTDAFEPISESELVTSLLTELDPKDAVLLDQYYGISTGKPMKLREIGNLTGVSHEAVRQQIQEAMKSARHRIKKLI